MIEQEAAVPPLRRLSELVAGRIPSLLDDVGRLFAAQWPEYASVLAAERPEVSLAASEFVQRLIKVTERELSDGDPPSSLPADPSVDALLEAIGRSHWRRGEDLTTLLAAYHVGARVAWRHVSDAALELDIDPVTLAALAQSVFLIVEQLSSASARGYVTEQSEAAVARERLRDELAELLISDRSDSATVAAAAARAGWSLPKEVAVVLVDPEDHEARRMLSRCDASCLPLRRGGLTGLVVPDPSGPGHRDRLAVALRGARAVVGHTVPLRQLPASVHVARVAARLRRAGILTDDPVFADDHLDAIIVHHDRRLLAALRDRSLAPLEGLSPETRERLCRTLASWLRHLGDRQAVAEELHIHPQTVRYRMRQVRQCLGAGLDDPAERRRLTLALWWGEPLPSDPASTAG